tara:strand:+ start:107 stop:304 length:198 start_codon:yes stop_codon:yes gene_type:complete
MAKGVAHYDKKGTLIPGPTHKMPDGSLHSGKTHSKKSVPLFHLKELPKSVQTKIKKGMKSAKKQV